MVGSLFCAATLAWLVALCWYDLRYGRLPNVLTVPAVVVAAGAALVWAAMGGCGALIGGACTGLIYGVAYTFRGVGAGDVKLALPLGALVGAFCGPSQVVVFVLVAQVITLMCCAAVRRRTVPHGPAMCAAFVVSLAISST